jgi:acyl dehydratase
MVEVEAVYNRRDCILYSLGIGCNDLRFIYENHPDFQVFPTILFALTLKGDSSDTQPFPPPFMKFEEVPIAGPVLDAERYVELYRPLNSSETLSMNSKCLSVSSKSSGTLVQTETIMTEVGGQVVARIVSGAFYVGSKGESLNKGQYHDFTEPLPLTKSPDTVVEERVSLNQCAIYRLSGDYNPLHIDPDIACTFGFEKPILHGLCTLGFAVRAVVSAFGGNKACSVKKIACRFSKPFIPGNVLQTEMWKISPNRIAFRVVSQEDKKVVIDRAYVDFDPIGASKL